MRNISIEDAASCLGLVEECTELWDDPLAWQDHLTSGIERLIGGCSGAFGASRMSGASGVGVLEFHIAPGNEGIRQSVMSYQQNGGFALLPEYDVIRPIVANEGRIVYQQRDVVTRKEYHRSFFYQTYMRQHVIEGLLSAVEVRPDGLVVGLGIMRQGGESAFSDRDHAVLELVTHCVAQRARSRLTMRDQVGRHQLSARLRDTLDVLLDGANEKTIAQRLGIGVSTAHEYVLALYRHFGVHSRSQLLALFVRRRPENATDSARTHRTRSRGGAAPRKRL